MIAIIGAILFLLLAVRNRRSTLLSFLLFVYSLSFIATVIMSMNISRNINVVAYCYLLLILLIFLYAFKGNIQLSRIVVTHQLVNIARVFTVILLPATIFYGYYAVQTFLYVDMSTSRIDKVNLLPANIFNTFFVFFSTLYFIPLFLFYVFYSEHCHRSLRTIMFISTLSYPMLTFCYSGRDGALYWVMCMFVYFLLFKDVLGKKELRTIKILFYCIAAILALAFIVVSIARFSVWEGGTINSLVGYLGQQTYHFSTAFESEFFQGYGTLFPGWKKILGIEGDGRDITDFAKAGFLEEYNTFGFFVKTVVCGYGKIFALFVAGVFVWIVQYYIRKYKKQKNIIDLIVVITLFQIPMNGLFYYRQGIGMGDVIYTIFLVGLLGYRKLFDVQSYRRNYR